jgi:hypothetical protein
VTSLEALPYYDGLCNIRCKPDHMFARHPAQCKQHKPSCVTSRISPLVGCCSIACQSTWQTMRRQAPAPLGAQMLFYFTLLPSNHIMFFNPRILDQTTLFPLAATKSSLDFRQTKPCFGSEIKPNLVGTCIQKRFDDALEHVLHRVSHTVSFCLWSSSSHLELIQSLTFLH